ncbi:MAG: NAD-binding protein [Magnetococcales bacterium]|nr:NAD-binding protein [Magnetococcales bacterium]
MTMTIIYQSSKDFVRAIFTGKNKSGQKLLNLIMMVLVITSIWIMIVENDPQLTRSEVHILEWLDESFTWFFLIEYLLRLWVCSDFRLDYDTAFRRYKRRLFNPRLSRTILHALQAALSNKFKWMIEPLSIIDLLAILPLFRMFRLFRVLRVFRLLKLFRYSKRLHFFVKIMQGSSFELKSLFSVALVIWGMVAIAFYLSELNINPNITNIWESIYWVTITITTVGYGDITPMTSMGQFVAVIGVLTGIWVIIFMTSIVVSSLMEQIVSLREFKMINRAERMKNHIIVCGLDTLGRAVCQSLEAEGRTFVGVDLDQSRVDLAAKNGWVVLQGDAREETVWQSLRLEYAHSVISTFEQEMNNVYVVLLVREKNPRCHIVVTGESSSSEKRMKRAGANKVVSPYLIGGYQLVHNAIRPNAIKLIDLAMKKEHKELTLEEIYIPKNSILVGLSLISSSLRTNFNIIVVGISRQDEEMVFNPSANTIINEGDLLICMGNEDDLHRLVKYASGGKTTGITAMDQQS